LKTKLNGIFLSYYLNNAKKYEIANMAQGISVVHLYASQLQNLEIEIPSLPEQTKIASFLSELDTKINTIQSEIENTEKWKKGLLQQMFV
jgi:type I restriction enzyme S subunit